MKKTDKEKKHEKISFVEKAEELSKQKVDVWRLKKYVCKIKPINIKTGKNVIVLNTRDAQEHDIYSGYRTEVCYKGKCIIAIVDVSEEEVAPGQIGVFNDIRDLYGMKDGEKVEIVHMNRPASIGYIKKKLDNGVLNEEEIRTIVADIMQNRLSEIETSAWISATYINNLTDSEIIALTKATVDSGEKLDLGKKLVVDKHCIGGVAGNRTTMVVVPIIAAAGLYIPKTSSRAITSAAGTADTMEVLAEVNFTLAELKEIVLKAKGAMVWGGGMKLAPVDDKLIKVRHPLSLDPEGMLLASILAKKKSVGARYIIIDIPVGRGVKVPYMERAKELAKHFLSIGQSLDMGIEALITDGAEPVGWGVGPVLECKDVLEVLEGNGPEDLRHKSVLMAGKLLELAGSVKKGGGYDVAEKLISSGKALAKFREIVGLQGGNQKIRSSDISSLIGQYSYTLKSSVSGSIFHIDNKIISKIARISGAPMDKGAGVLLHRLRGDRVQKGDPLFTIYAESESKLDFALKALVELEPIEMRKMLLGTLS
jgi:AMP phosphorylase